MWVLLWIVFGGLVGWVASKIMRTDAEQGIVLNIVVGIVGAVLGGWLVSYFGGSGVTGFNVNSFAVALLGAIVLIVAVKLLRRR
jgi:uncharacterized membrane protein YeaQ/YmgE (transglycosylase-associated protein family)